MEGKGTQTEPYLVGTVTEFREACTQENAYVKLIKDIDCNKEDRLEWVTLNSKATEVDLDNHTLKNPHIAEGNHLINGNGKTTLKNGKMLNIYENAGTGVLYNITLENTAVSTDLKRTTGIPFNKISAFNCNFNVIHNHLSDINSIKEIFYLTNINGINGLQDTRIEINGIVVDDIITADASTVEIKGCRLEGKVNYDSSKSMTRGAIYAIGKLRNSVIAFDLKNIGASAGIRLCKNAGNTNIVRDDICVLDNYDGALRAGEQILDPAHNISLGFDVVEVKI